ncbi:Septum formation initiator [Gluconacetobacter diazotrophicus PA1 5]|uniref:Septation inhibitor protein n=2 Tax=Gluconacetobacter diazotrophicus TaxID=33996 RepID=A0A7W4I518_GLUDI|nr:septum formation initiator family protein [Gluconacetobacter diazotrophicus]ACI49948.1 Septum formation initiator [Gluconacetobacter diazotrophicus PA1 5]MBB2156499.1 septation inhibitor protein [Gluconacetobacter diazotrophicus]CAP55869.1 putative septum formation initiator protein [Gluconacetobacter diazotrophicus PA1 5]
MQIGRMIRRAIRMVIPPALFIGLTAYFGWNVMQGDHGLQSYKAQLQLLAEARAAQQDAMAEQQVWVRRVRGLKESALDSDTLDERARAMLNLSRPDELVVPYGAHEHLY